MRVQLEASSARLPPRRTPRRSPRSFLSPYLPFCNSQGKSFPCLSRTWLAKDCFARWRARRRVGPGGSSLRPNPPRSQAPLKPTRGKAVPKPLISTYVHKYEVSYAGVVDAAATIYGDTERERAGHLDKARHLVTWPAASKQRPLSLRARREGPLCGPKSGLPYQLYVSAPRAKKFGSLGWPVGCQAAPGLCHCAPPPSRHRWQPHGPFATLSSNSY